MPRRERVEKNIYFFIIVVAEGEPTAITTSQLNMFLRLPLPSSLYAPIFFTTIFSIELFLNCNFFLNFLKFQLTVRIYNFKKFKRVLENFKNSK